MRRLLAAAAILLALATTGCGSVETCGSDCVVIRYHLNSGACEWQDKRSGYWEVRPCPR